MKSIRKLTALLLAFTMLAIPGCGKIPSQDESSQVGSAVLTKDGIKYVPEVTLTTARPVGSDVKFKNNETIENNAWDKYIKETIGIQIQYLWTTPATNDAFTTKLKLSLSANETLPDILSVPNADAHFLLNSGRFQPVGDLFEEYAADSWKKALDEVPNAWTPYVRNGQKMAIPQLEYNLVNEDVMWVRQDWLDKLGLKAPSTVEELEVVMDAFVNKDPDGNNVKDTYGLAVTLKDNYSSYIGAGPLFGAFGALPQAWQFDKNGEIVYGGVRPEIKDALSAFKKWIELGYIHMEAGLHDETKASALFTSGQAGIAFCPTWAFAWPLNETEINVKGAQVSANPLPVGPNGDLMQISNGSHQGVYLINKDMKHPEIFFSYLNFMFDYFPDPKPGEPFEYGIIQGYDYDFVDGKLVTSDSDIPGGRVDPQKYFLGAPPRNPNAYIELLAKMADGYECQTPFEMRYAFAAQPQRVAAKIAISQAEYVVENLFQGEPTNTMEDKLANLQRMEVEIFSEILYGKKDIGAFDKYVDDWYAAGGKQITEEVREWYKSTH